MKFSDSNVMQMLSQKETYVLRELYCISLFNTKKEERKTASPCKSEFFKTKSQRQERCPLNISKRAAKKIGRIKMLQLKSLGEYQNRSGIFL